MAKFKQGDCISVCIKNNTIISPYNDYHDEVLLFEILAADEQGYFLYIPSYRVIKNTITIDKALCRSLQLDKKYLYEETIYITENMIYRIEKISDGETCSSCREFFKFAVPNSEGLFVCWSCRHYKFYK